MHYVNNLEKHKSRAEGFMWKVKLEQKNSNLFLQLVISNNTFIVVPSAISKIILSL